MENPGRIQIGYGIVLELLGDGERQASVSASDAYLGVLVYRIVLLSLLTYIVPMLNGRCLSLTLKHPSQTPLLHLSPSCSVDELSPVSVARHIVPEHLQEHNHYPCSEDTAA